MEMLLSLIGIAGAACCVVMYAAVSLGRIDADRPIFFIVNGIGALLILISAARHFDLGDLGTIGQEGVWAVISAIGAGRAWWLVRGREQWPAWKVRGAATWRRMRAFLQA